MARISPDAVDCDAQVDVRLLRNQPKSPARTPRKNASHSAAVKISAGPSGKRELRTATPVAARNAASTQLPLGLLNLLLRQAARKCDARTPFWA
jgi:hypothetical protein